MKLSLNLALGALFALTIARLWVMPMSSSLWMDEANTAFVIQYGSTHPTLALMPMLSPLYWLFPKASVALLGFSEFALRLPSVLAAIVGLFFTVRLAARLIHPQAGWLTAFACLTMAKFNFAAVDARPYALGLAVMTAALWFLVRWFDRSRHLDAVLFLVLAAVLWRIHPMFWPCYIVFVGYAVARVGWKETGVTWLRAGVVFTILGLALLPVFFDVLALRSDALAHVVVPQPGRRVLLMSVHPVQVIGAAALAWLLARLWRTRAGTTAPSRASLVLIALWWVAAPFSLYAFSHLTGVSTFVGRYFSETLPGCGLAIATIVVLLAPVRFWKPVAVVMGVCALLVYGQWPRMWPGHDESDWRAGAAVINRSWSPTTPVVLVSPFVETHSPVWHADMAAPSVLYSIFLVYPTQGKSIFFPFEPSAEAEEYATKLARTELAASGRFILFGFDRSVPFWERWFGARGWTTRRIGPFGDVMVVELARK